MKRTMKNLLSITLLLSSAIIVSTPLKNKKSTVVKSSTVQQNVSKISQETLNLLNIKKQNTFDETLQLNLPELNIATATIIANKEARKFYNKEYKKARKLQSLVIKIHKTSTQKDEEFNIKNIKFKENDNDYSSPIHQQFPEFFSSINEGIYE